MRSRNATYAVLLAFVLCGAGLSAQSADRVLNFGAQLLDLLFPLELKPWRPFNEKIILRYENAASQLTVYVYPGNCELVRHSLPDVPEGGLFRIISQKKDARLEEIARGLRVGVERVSVDCESIESEVEKLKRIRISPVLDGRAVFGNLDQVEYWYDTGQQCVRYTINGTGSKGLQEGALYVWMVEFKKKADAMIDRAGGPSGPHAYVP